MKRFISIIVVCCFLLANLPSFAQEEASEKNKDEEMEVELKPIKSETFSEETISRKFDTLRKVNKKIKAIDSHLKGKGFAAKKQKGKKNFWGIRETYESRKQRQHKKGKKKVTYTVQLQNYSKQDSRDAAAIGQVTVTAGEETQTYSFYLLAPNGNLKAMEEYKVDQDLNISRANCWWSCVIRAIKNRCAAPCLGSLLTCIPSGSTVVGYVICVASECGFCALKSMACCGCDCSWWCKWAVGCCDR